MWIKGKKMSFFLFGIVVKGDPPSPWWHGHPFCVILVQGPRQVTQFIFPFDLICFPASKEQDLIKLVVFKCEPPLSDVDTIKLTQIKQLYISRRKKKRGFPPLDLLAICLALVHASVMHVTYCTNLFILRMKLNTKMSIRRFMDQFLYFFWSLVPVNIDPYIYRHCLHTQHFLVIKDAYHI